MDLWAIMDALDVSDAAIAPHLGFYCCISKFMEVSSYVLPLLPHLNHSPSTETQKDYLKTFRKKLCILIGRRSDEISRHPIPSSLESESSLFSGSCQPFGSCLGDTLTVVTSQSLSFF